MLLRLHGSAAQSMGSADLRSTEGLGIAGSSSTLRPALHLAKQATSTDLTAPEAPVGAVSN
jgi:hypothetical protein